MEKCIKINTQEKSSLMSLKIYLMEFPVYMAMHYLDEYNKEGYISHYALRSWQVVLGKMIDLSSCSLWYHERMSYFMLQVIISRYIVMPTSCPIMKKQVFDCSMKWIQVQQSRKKSALQDIGYSNTLTELSMYHGAFIKHTRAHKL